MPRFARFFRPTSVIRGLPGQSAQRLRGSGSASSAGSQVHRQFHGGGQSSEKNFTMLWVGACLYFSLHGSVVFCMTELSRMEQSLDDSLTRVAQLEEQVGHGSTSESHAGIGVR